MYVGTLNKFMKIHNNKHDILFEDDSTQLCYTVINAISKGVSLAGAMLCSANLAELELFGADLSGAQLFGADLHRTNLHGANLAGAILAETNLYRADLSDCQLTGADLSFANLSSTNLARANLLGADLSHARMLQTNLLGTNLTGTNQVGLHKIQCTENDISDFPKKELYAVILKDISEGSAEIITVANGYVAAQTAIIKYMDSHDWDSWEARDNERYFNIRDNRVITIEPKFETHICWR